MEDERLIEFLSQNKDFVNELKPFLGPSTRRKFGGSSKKIYEMMGGREQGEMDISKLKLQKMKKKVDDQVDTIAGSIPFVHFKDDKKFRTLFKSKLDRYASLLSKNNKKDQLKYLYEEYLSKMMDIDIQQYK